VYFAANLLSAILTNNAAAVVTYPIAMEAVDQTGVDRKKMALVLLLAASDYMTSFGYQTNLMVYGPGGYTNSDFFKFGCPMQILLWLSSTAMVAADMDNFFISWIITAIGLVLVAAIRLTNGEIMRRLRAKNH
jgi:di/tricarboxylate transporter